MNRDTTRIDLPPPRTLRSRRRVPRLWWILLVALALGTGAGAGLWVGQQRASTSPSATASESGAADATVAEAVEPKVAAARAAAAAGEWLEARRLFAEVSELDPENPHALASLPLIDRRLAEARGSVLVATAPPGAGIVIEGLGSFTSPATIQGLPMGEHRLSIGKPGYEETLLIVEVTGEVPVDLGTVALVPSSGRLEVVSEPRGAEFKLLKTIENDQVELVEIGSTPALLEALSPGEYEVLMAVEGWPEFSERVRVENNRNSSVSAVFARGDLNLTSDPSGAEVWLHAEGEEPKLRGATPLSLSGLPAGSVRLELRYADWPPIARTVEVEVGAMIDLDFAWDRALVAFESDPPGATVYREGTRRLGDGRETTPFQMEMPEGEYLFTATHPQLGSKQKSVYVQTALGSHNVAFHFPYGSVSLTSEPSGAAVVADGVPIGRTPLTLPVVPPGTHTYRLAKENHLPAEVSGTLYAGGSLDFTATLKFDAAPVASRSFRNGLGQELVWIGELNGWVAAHETTQAVYERITGTNPSYFKDPNHPVDSVTWYQANAFCEALNVMERGLGNLPAGYRYRLPTDEEWSRFVGQQKLDGAVSSLFERRSSTAPVGSLEPNEFGLFDVRGNVWEWVSDWYSHTIVNRVRQEGATPTPDWVGTDRKVLRGGAWNRSAQYDLSVANRMAARPSAEDRYDVGFRVVLMPVE